LRRGADPLLAAGFREYPSRSEGRPAFECRLTEVGENNAERPPIPTRVHVRRAFLRRATKNEAGFSPARESDLPGAFAPLPDDFDDASPEFRFLVHSLRTPLDQRIDASSMLRADGDVDGKRLLALLVEHRLVPWLFARSRQGLGIELPEDVSTPLGRLHLGLAHRALELAAETAKVSRALAAARVPAVHLKGPALSLSLWGGIERRQAGDLDVFVDPLQVSRAREVLAALGYTRWWGHGIVVDAASERYHDRHAYESRYRIDGKDWVVDLHWRLFRAGWLEIPEMTTIFDRARDVEIGGVAVRTLGDEDEFAYLLLHGTKHVWERLSWILDFARVITRSTAESWPSRLERLSSAGLVRPLALALLVAHRVAGSVVPETLRDLVADTTVESLARHVLRSIARRSRTNSTRRGGDRAKLGYLLGLHSSLGYKARVVRSILSPEYSSDWQTFRLPGYLFPLYRMFRPLRLACRHFLGRSAAPEEPEKVVGSGRGAGGDSRSTPRRM
jgi:hypothetical protein